MEKSHLEDIWCWVASSWREAIRRMFSPEDGWGLGKTVKKKTERKKVVDISCKRNPRRLLPPSPFSSQCIFHVSFQDKTKSWVLQKWKISSNDHNSVTHRITSQLWILKGTRSIDCARPCAKHSACISAGSHPSSLGRDWYTRNLRTLSEVTWLMTDGVGAMVLNFSCTGKSPGELSETLIPESRLGILS